MKNRVLIIYPFINQEQLVFNLVKNLRINGVGADAINFYNLKLAIKSLHRHSRYVTVISFLFSLRIYKIDSFFSKVFSRERVLLKMAEKYDVIDFHFLSKSYDSLIIQLANSKIIKLTFWGSDFYRASLDRREEQRNLLRLATVVQVSTHTMKLDIAGYFRDFDDKIKVANFGIYQFDVISKVRNSQYLAAFKTREFENKLMIVCGYNGSMGQQHSIIIEALAELEQSVKDKIFVVFPMTYGGDADYKSEIEYQMRKLKIPFLLLGSHLSDFDIAKLRLESDIVVNIQTTDAFSGSLQEHLFSENLLLVGDWLPYQILDENGIFLKRTNLKDLNKNLSNCIVDFQNLKYKTRGNREKIYQISSWKFAGKRITEIYKDIIK